MACTECCVCLEAPRACVLRPCNHLCVCATCAQVSFLCNHLCVSAPCGLFFSLALVHALSLPRCLSLPSISLSPPPPQYSVHYCLLLQSRKYSQVYLSFTHTHTHTHTHTQIHAPQHSCIRICIRNCGKGRGLVRCADCLLMMYSLYSCKHALACHFHNVYCY